MGRVAMRTMLTGHSSPCCFLEGAEKCVQVEMSHDGSGWHFPPATEGKIDLPLLLGTKSGQALDDLEKQMISIQAKNERAHASLREAFDYFQKAMARQSHKDPAEAAAMPILAIWPAPNLLAGTDVADGPGCRRLGWR